MNNSVSSLNFSPQEILDIIVKLYPYNYSVTSFNSFDSTAVYLDYLDFKVHSFPSLSELNGWTIPNGWKCCSALIKHKGQVIYDCLEDSPLGCAYLSPSFSGSVSKSELIDHCAFRKDLPSAIVYDWTRLYRKGISRWGLSIPFNQLETLPDEDLEVEIITEESPSEMHVYDYLLKGQLDDEIIINAHNCHPFQANDDISGCAVGIYLFQQLLQRKRLKYSYRLLICPELFGPMFWLDAHNMSSNIKSAILLKSLGNKSILNIQHSYESSSYIDIIAKLSLEGTNIPYLNHPYREYYGNDETVFESPGFNIPSITYTTYPFNQYHTNLDTPDQIDLETLGMSYQAVFRLVETLEKDAIPVHVKPGLYCLSNPKYNLYRSAPEPGISSLGISDLEKKWNLLMNKLPRLLQESKTISQISSIFDLPFNLVYEYVNEWERKSLTDLDKRSSLF